MTQRDTQEELPKVAYYRNSENYRDIIAALQFSPKLVAGSRTSRPLSVTLFSCL